MDITLQIFYLVAIIIALICNLYIIYLCDKRRNQVVARYLSYIVIISTLILITWLGISLAPNQALAFFWMRLRLSVVSLTPVVAIFLFFHLLNWREWIVYPRSIVLWLLPFANFIILWLIPDKTSLIRTWSWTRHEVLAIEAIQFGAVQTFNNLYFILIFVLFIWVVRYRYSQVSRLANLQIAWIFAGISVVWFLTSLGTWGLTPPGFPAPYPIAAVVGSVMVIYGLRLSPLTDAVPIAHELVFRDIPQSVIVLNNDDQIVDINLTAKQLFMHNHDPIGKRINHYPLLAQTLNTPTSHEIEIDGRFYNVGVSNIQRTNSLPFGRILIFTDITERKTNEVEREHLVRTLDAYARTVAHDLKNPVGVIGGYLELLEASLEKHIDHERILGYIKKARRSNDHMNNIIHSMLLLATLRQNEKVSLEVINMQKTLNQVLERLGFDIENAGAKIYADTSLPNAIGYKNWVEEIWLNYLSNAIKYGGNPPVIHITVTPDPLSDKLIRYNIHDNGTGLTNEEKSALFRPMTRLDRHAGIEGYGLGLNIVHQMVERMGGNIHIESIEGQGSTFGFSLSRA